MMPRWELLVWRLVGFGLLLWGFLAGIQAELALRAARRQVWTDAQWLVRQAGSPRVLVAFLPALFGLGLLLWCWKVGRRQQTP